MLQVDLSLDDRELSLSIASFCAGSGKVRSVKVHRRPKPFALIEMASDHETSALAAQFSQSAFGNCVVVHLQAAEESNLP